MNDLFHKSRRCAQSIIGTALFVTSIFLVTSGFLISAPVHAVEVERVVSPGGIEAWLVRDQSIPITSLAFSFQDAGGAEDPHGKSGLANLTASLLGEGAGDLDSQAFQGQLENLAIRLSFSAGLETFRGNLKTLNRNRDEAVNLLRLALSKARFDEDAVQRIRSQIEIGLKQRQTDPNSRAGRIWRKAMFADHPNGRPVNGTLTTLGAITTDDMRNFVASRLT
ncbi:MAG: M16 family metallopeptidase, partial [Alphaproteobacteria bacterium]